MTNLDRVWLCTGITAVAMVADGHPVPGAILGIVMIAMASTRISRVEDKENNND